MDPNAMQGDLYEYSREQFLELTKDALDRFYDLTHLENHPFAQKVRRRTNSLDATRGQLLQKDLSRAITILDSDLGHAGGSNASRRYTAMRLRYIERLTIQNIAYEMDISERQVYRELRQGEEDLATILQSWYVEDTIDPQSDESENSALVNVEIEQLKTDFQAVDLKTLLYSAQASIEQLAANRRVSIEIDAPADSVMISTDPVVAKHILINLLSSAVQRASGTTVQLRLTSSAERTALSLDFSTQSDQHNGLVNDITTELVHRLKWEITHDSPQAPIHTVELSFGKNIPTVLVIDDYDGLSRLLKRYLAGYRCRILAASDGASGLSFARETRPDAVILDVMMPQMDGWEVLQRLRNHPDTRHIPVIICSVFNDPGLAHALGASSFISKPIKRDDIVQALQQEHIL